MKPMTLVVWLAGFALLGSPGFLVAKALRLTRREDPGVALAIQLALQRRSPRRLPRAEVGRINAIVGRWSDRRPGADDDAWTALRSAGVTHIFCDWYAGDWKRRELLTSRSCRAIYRDGATNDLCDEAIRRSPQRRRGRRWF